MSFRYNNFIKQAKRIYRKFFPIEKSSYTMGEIKDICSVNLVPSEDLKKFFKGCIEQLQELKGENIGDYLEFGVFNGASISSVYEVSKGLNIKTRLFGFDAFEGLPPESENEDDGVWKKGFYSCSFEKMSECLERKGIDVNGITWIKGWYKDTLNLEIAKKCNIENLGIVFIDCDTYSSSKAVLDFISPLIKSPVIICLDDWKLNDLDLKEIGEYKSFNEFLESNPHLQASEIKSYNRKSKSFLVRPV